MQGQTPDNPPLFFPANQCNTFCDVTNGGWTDLDRLMMIQNQHKSVGEQTKTDVFGVINRLVPMFKWHRTSVLLANAKCVLSA